MGPLATVALLKASSLFSLGVLDCCSELTKSGLSAADGGAADRLHGGQGDRGIGVVVLWSEEVLTITSMLSAGKAVFYRPKDNEMLADAAR
jgi:pre-mRNA-splicing factor ATP-dependent RNA helicase DHX16